MDTSATGHFIAERRKQKGLTQKELAERLQVSDKAVSRWETGIGFPDTSLLKPLSDILEVSVSELLSGKLIEGEKDMREQTDQIILDALGYSRRMLADLISFVLFLAGSVLLVSPFVLIGRYILLFRKLSTEVSPLNLTGRHNYWVIGIVLIVIALVWAALRRAKKRIRLSDKGCYILGVVFLIAALVLEVLPIGVVMVFGTGSGETIRETFSYFDLTPFGNAHFSPLPTGILTVVSVLLGIISAIRYNTIKKTKSAAFICSILAAALSLLPLLYGGRYMVAASYAVFTSIAISVCFQAVANRHSL